MAAQIHEARTLRHQATEAAEALYPQQLGEAMTPHGEGWKRETVADVIKSMDAGWSPQCDDIPARLTAAQTTAEHLLDAPLHQILAA